jgi:hypothetical protein
MDAFLRNYDRGVTKLRRTKKKVKDAFGLDTSRSAAVPRESLAGASLRAHSASPSSHSRASMDETTVRRDAISRGTTNPSSTMHRPASQLRAEHLGLDTEISNPQSPLVATKCECACQICSEMYITNRYSRWSSWNWIQGTLSIQC